MKNCVYVNSTAFGMSISQKSSERKALRTEGAGSSPAVFFASAFFAVAGAGAVAAHL